MSFKNKDYNNNPENHIPALQYIINDNDYLINPIDGYSVFMETISGNVKILKNFINFLKEYTDVNITFKKDSCFTVEYVNPTDCNETIVFYAIFYGDSFESFYVKEDKTICIDIENLFKYFKSFTGDCALRMSILDDNTSNIFNLNVSTQICTQSNEIIYREPIVGPINIPNIDYDFIIKLDASAFQKNIKTIKNSLTEKMNDIDIVCNKDKLQFNYQNLHSNSNTIEYYKNRGGIQYFKESDGICSFKISITDIQGFSRFYKISGYVKLYLSNLEPLGVEYDIGGLGLIQVFISHKKN